MPFGFFNSWSHRASNSTQRGRRPASSRLRLECLEDRAVPATFNVTTTLDVIDPADGKRSLREAITAANNLAGADVIVLSAGVYKITGTGENLNATGDLDIAGTLTIQGPGAGLAVIDGQHLDRVFDIFGTAPSSIKVVFQGLTVRNGSVTGDGGGVQIGNADLVLRDCVVTGNRASENGGGVSNISGTGSVTLVRTTVSRNVAGDNSGGGLAVFLSSLTLKESTIRRNIASGAGGGISANTATLANSTVSGNIAGDSGGGINTAGTVTLTNSTVSGNHSNVDGGGISSFGSTVTLSNSTVRGNSAGDEGGGIFSTTSATLTNSTISGNSSVSFGGGIGKIFGQEKNITTYNLARMNMLLHGVKDTEFEIYHGDTLTNDWDMLKEPNPAKMPKLDAVVANPPFSYRWEPTESLGEDVRFKNYGLAPKSAADFAFLLHGFHYLKDEGVMAIILPHGVLFRGGAEERIRTKLLKDGSIDTVIGLPANLFYSTGIPVCILVLKKCKKPDDVLIINAAEHFEKGKRQNQLTDKHIGKIIDTYQHRKEEARYSRRVGMKEIEEHEFNLNISRYVSTAEAEEEIDLKATHNELVNIEKKRQAARDRHNKYLKELGLPPLP